MPKKPAREKLMDYLARRDHSEMELRQKLRANYEDSEISEAIEEAKETGWLPEEGELSKKVARQLDARGKGYLYICNYLRKKGLPRVPKNSEIEMSKALDFAEAKLGPDKKTWKENTDKLCRWLKSRGFEDETIWKVVYGE